MGFVTKRDSSAGSYGYIDYKVAQHTTDYHAWHQAVLMVGKRIMVKALMQLLGDNTHE